MANLKNLEEFFRLKEFKMNSNKIMLIIAIVTVILLSIIGYLVYIFFFEEGIGEKQGTFKLEKMNSDFTMSVSNNEIVKSITHDSYTFSFWITINDFYKNNSYWRHLFHRGTPVSKQNVLDYKYWENIEKEINLQSPGVWLHPDNNSIRIAISTIINTSYPNESEALIVTEPPVYYSRKSNVNNRALEICDIENIPVDEATNITFTLDKRLLTVYLNGKIIKICNFKGQPIMTEADTYFNYPKTYSGYLSNFVHIPMIVKNSKIKQLCENKPISE